MVTLQQVGIGVEGSFDMDGGKISGTYRNGVLEGTWSENDSDRRCAFSQHAREHWGSLRWEFDGDKFTGGWGYCTDKPDHKAWTGHRIE